MIPTAGSALGIRLRHTLPRPSTLAAFLHDLEDLLGLVGEILIGELPENLGAQIDRIDYGSPTVIHLIPAAGIELRGEDTLRVVAGLCGALGQGVGEDPQAEILRFIDECLPSLASRPRRHLVRVALPFLEHLESIVPA